MYYVIILFNLTRNFVVSINCQSLVMLLLRQVFLRYYHADELHAVLQTSVNLVTTCQAYVRGLLTRRRFENQLQQRVDATERMCDELQKLVIGTSSQHADAQRILCQDDRTRRTAKAKVYHF